MADLPTIEQLARDWRDAAHGTAFAALADAYRKRGEFAEAAAVALQGLVRHPGNVPGLIVLSRIRRQEGDILGSEEALREALALDAGHPLVRQLLGEPPLPPLPVDLATVPIDLPPLDDEVEALLFAEGDADVPEDVLLSDPQLQTESLAALYHAQGHVERAGEVYGALLRRNPENPELRQRVAAIADELAGRRPRPYDAAASGGRPLRDWLAAVAAAAPAPIPAATPFDAFFEAPAPSQPPDELADFEAFQSWLKGLGK